MATDQKDIETFCPKNQQEWRLWLQENHEKKQSVWLICYKVKAAQPTLPWSNAVDEALCFGWVDSIRKPIDDDCYMQFFGKRKPKSTWSKINKAKIEQLSSQGLMTKAGYNVIEVAKQNGSWTILDDVEALIIPEDLNTAFKLHNGSKLFFTSLSKSVQKAMLQWIVLAMLPATRHKRITEIATLAAQKLKPKQF